MTSPTDALVCRCRLASDLLIYLIFAATLNEPHVTAKPRSALRSFARSTGNARKLNAGQRKYIVEVKMTVVGRRGWHTHLAALVIFIAESANILNRDLLAAFRRPLSRQFRWISKNNIINWNIKQLEFLHFRQSLLFNLDTL